MTVIVARRATNRRRGEGTAALQLPMAMMNSVLGMGVAMSVATMVLLACRYKPSKLRNERLRKSSTSTIKSEMHTTDVFSTLSEMYDRKYVFAEPVIIFEFPSKIRIYNISICQSHGAREKFFKYIPFLIIQ